MFFTIKNSDFIQRKRRGIQCGGSLILKGGIIGGSSYSEKGFCLPNLGNAAGIQTTLSLGSNEDIRGLKATAENQAMEFLLENYNRMAAVLVDMQNTMLKTEADFLQKSNIQIIDLLGAIAGYRNQESGEHIRRNKDYTRILAEEFMKEFPEKTLHRRCCSV